MRRCADSSSRPPCSPCSRSRPPRPPIRPDVPRSAETVAPGPGTGFVPLAKGNGESYVVRRGGSAKAKRKRAARRRSLAFFAQLTDPQIADEMSPARVDFVDPAGGAVKSSHRPQEALGLQTFDAVVRNVNANRRSTRKGRNGRRAKLGFAITTGDLADNQQFNETKWFRTVLDGGTVDPFSGRAGRCQQPVQRRLAGRDREAECRRGRAPLHRRAGLRRLARRARRPLRRLLGPRRGSADDRRVRRLPELSGADGSRAGAVRRPGPQRCRGSSRAATTTAWSRATPLPAPTCSARSRPAASRSSRAPRSIPRRSSASTRARCSRSSTTRRSSPRCSQAAAACRRIRTAGSSPRRNTAR